MLVSNDFVFDFKFVYYGNWEFLFGYEKIYELMKFLNLLDGIFCVNDLMVIGCIEVFKELGKFIFEDVVVVGFDNCDIV